MAAIDLAEQALSIYLAAPAEAARKAQEAAHLAGVEGDLRAASTAERAMGLAAQHLQDFDVAARHLRTAISLAKGAGDPVLAGEARMNLAYILAHQGRTALALRHLSLAEPVLHGAKSGWLFMEQALLLKNLGRWEQALGAYNKALDAFRRDGDAAAEATALVNRGVVHIYRWSLAAAQSDLLRAEELSLALGYELTLAITRHNLGYVLAQRGDVPGALASYDAAEAAYRTHRLPPPTLWIDRCELLLAAGLPGEARGAATQAVADAERSRQDSELAEARLRLAQAALADGDAAAARADAAAAACSFIRARRPAWAALARYVTLLADVAANSPVPPVRARRAATALEKAGWGFAARDARMIAARLDLGRGRPREARRDLRRLATCRRSGTVGQRVQGWHAEALLRLSRGDNAGARRAAARGLDLVEDYRATLGATDLRARASVHLAELADLGMRVALSDARPTTILGWAERCRAAHLLQRPGRPPEDDALAGALAELRRVVTGYEASVEAGALRTGSKVQQVRLERAIRDRSRLLQGTRAPGPPRRLPVGQLAAALADRALVEYVVLDGGLHAVTLAAGRRTLVDLGPVAPVAHELVAVPMLLRRLAAAGGPSPGVDAATAALDHRGRRLDALLLRPLAGRIGTRPLVVVPSGALQSVPWPLLPSCRGRPVSVTPSATLWLAAEQAEAPSDGGRSVFVAGPRLPHASAEVRALAAGRGDSVVLEGPAATAEAVLHAIDGAALAHIAAHGSFRSDNPQFSALSLHDGPLTVYDLERLRRPPGLVVLSACESGRSAVLSGDELLGLAAAFIRLGTRGLVASIVHVPDAETVPLMLALHDRLRGGDDLAAALAAAQSRAAPDEPRHRAAALAFLSVGHG
jgi:tetratricopeptide (TPR) repeat protein